MEPEAPIDGTTVQRSLAAIVFTDAVGFSAKVGIDEDAAVARVKKDLDTMSRVCAQYDGQVVKTTGDGLMMMFNSAVQAVSCALEIQRAFGDNRKSDPDGQLLHRIGIHLGDVLIANGDAHGDGVNVAARLEKEAEAGGICMSQTVYDVVKNRVFLQAEKVGDLRLKNIVEPVRAYRVAGLNSSRKKPGMSPTFKATILGVGVAVLVLAGGWAGISAALRTQNPSKEPDNNVVSAPNKPKTDPANDAQTEHRSDKPLESETPATDHSQPANSDSAAQTPDTSTANPPATTPPTPVTSDSSSLTDDQRNAVLNSFVGFDQAWQQFVPKYDFKGMADWVARQDAKEDVNGRDKAQQHYDELAGLMIWFKSKVASRTKANPFHTLQNKEHVGLWGDAEGNIVISGKAGAKPKPLADFKPIGVAVMMMAVIRQGETSAIEKDRLLAQVNSFCSEFHLKPRSLKPIGKGNDNLEDLFDTTGKVGT